MSETITLTLKIGDKVEDDSLVILDEDRLCYSVRSVSNGGVGVRTISKALLAEWVEAYRKTPNASSQTVREQLVGKSEIDRFEYGYAGTLAKMAKMILGQIPVVHPNAEEVRQNEFYNWMLQVEKKSPKTAKDTARTYLPSISDDAEPRTASIWHGLREYLYNEKPSKRLYAIDSLVELDAVYGGINRVFQQDGEAGTLDPQRFKECKEWANSPKNHNSVRAAWAMYKRFMQWREVQNKTKDEPPSENVDRLDVSLKLFAEKRKEEEWCSDKTDGDANKPRAGYVANNMRRGVPTASPAVTLLQHGTAAQIRDWFKSANDPNSLKLVVDAVDDGDIVTFGPYLAHLIQPQVPAPARPAKFSCALESVARNMIAPDEFGVYDENAHKALSFLGLIDFPFSKDFTDLDYDDVLHAQRVIMRRLVKMKTPQVMEFGKAYSPSDPDWKAADYLTVYEFLWFVNENKDTISKECEAKMMKKADYSQATSKPAGKKPKVDFGNAEDVVLLRLAAALRAKPFAILAGHSGTGKSRMVRKLAYMTCAKGGYKALLEGADGKPAATPGNFCMVQVKPNWHDSTDLLGYYSEIGSAFRTTDFVKFICKAYAYPDVPFFVCLDEMNLAPVEQYFAEYLSAIESRKVKDDAEFLDGNGDEKTGSKVITDTLLDKSVWKSASDLGCEFTQSAYWVEKHGLTIPRNLFVVGTVNMDESTNQFSRKVLDRAFTLEMTDADFEHFGEQSPEPSYTDYAGDDFVEELLAGKLFASDLTADHKLKPTQVSNLNKLKPILADTSFVVAYRFANEYALYEDALEKMLLQFDSSTGAGGASAGTSSGAAEAPAVDVAAQPAGADGTQQSGAEGAGNSQWGASPSAKPEAFDDIILMKLLPRIIGDAELVLKIFAGDESAKLDDANVKGLAGLLEKKGASFKKMKEIVKRGGTSLTFWP